LLDPSLGIGRGMIEDFGADWIASNFKRPAGTAGGVIWLFGDSHASSIAKGLDAATWRTWRLKLVMTCTYSFLGGSNTNTRIVTAITSALKECVQAGDLLVFIYHAERFSSGSASFGYGESASIATYETRLRHLQSLVVQKNAKLVLFGDWQRLPHVGAFCYPMKLGIKLFNCSVSKMVLLRDRALYYSMLRNISKLPSVYFLNILDVLCGGDRCDETLPGTKTLGFADTNHLSDAGSSYLSPFICSFLRRFQK